MIRQAVFGLLFAAASVVRGQESTPEPTRLDTLLAGVPMWMPGIERIVVVDAPASCCAEMLSRLLVLDARTGSVVRQWGDAGPANGDSLQASHEVALRREAESVVGRNRMIPLPLDSVIEPPLFQAGGVLDWTLSIGPRSVRVGPVATAAVTMPSACCHGVEAIGTEPCAAFPNRWMIRSLPGTRRLLAGATLTMELDGCDQGPEYRVLRWTPASAGCKPAGH